jgi:uroporphyrinogen decarboxylase
LLRHYAKNAHEQTDYFVLANLPGILSLWHCNLEQFGYEHYFMMMAAQPEMVHYWMEFTTEQNELRLTQYLDACGEYINGIIIGDDYGNQQTTHLSPTMFRDQVKPYLKRICDLIHKKAPHVKIFHHSCGAVKSLIRDLIEAGADVLNPVQISARGMDPLALKREFGDDITFWGGGISTQKTLYRGTVEECNAEVKRNMEIFMKDGGFVFATDHDIQEHVAPEKIIAIFQTALESGKY